MCFPPLILPLHSSIAQIYACLAIQENWAAATNVVQSHGASNVELMCSMLCRSDVGGLR